MKKNSALLSLRADLPGGKRTYSTWGRPTITLEAYLAHHEEERARKEELESRAAQINALPGVVDHLPPDECAKLDPLAESDISVRLPVWAASRTTGVKPPLSPNGVAMLDPYELPIPTLAQFVKHAEKFGVECVYESAEHVLPEAELRQLDRELSRITPKRKRLFADDAKRDEHERIIELNETLSVAEVAKEVKRSQSYVRRVLKETGTPVSPLATAKLRRNRL